MSINNKHSLVDSVVEALKRLSLESVIKDEDLANSSETLESIRESDLYLSCMDKISTYDMFSSIPKHILVNAGINVNLDNYSNNPENIPDSYHQQLLSLMNEYITSTYVETNNYYRALNGLPDMGDIGDLILYPMNGVDENKFIHDMSIGELILLEESGQMDLIKESYGKRYLNHLGERKIPPYKSRRGIRFELIYTPEIIDKDILNIFKEQFEKSRVYVLKTVYSDAFKFNSEFYDNFISVFIMVQTIVDIIINIPETVIRREFFDENMMRDIFLSNGIDYFPEIPFRYQMAMIKNLNSLLKFKSTTRNLVDLCSIFGFDNIDIFKYYLLKDRRMDGDNFSETKYKVNDKGETVEDVEQNYNLKFIRVPIDDIADNHIRDNKSHVSYSDIVNSDEYWYSDNDKKEIDNKILNTNFNYVATKYLSLDTIYEMNKMSFDMTYFINMIFDNIELEEALQLVVVDIDNSKKFKLVDIICILYSLMYEKIGIKDTILDTSTKVLHVLGFNYDVNLSQLATYLNEKGYSFKDVGIDEFEIPDSPMLTYNDLLNIYTKNKDIQKHITDQMIKADTIEIYRIYKKIYDSLMVSKLNTSQFTDNSGNFTPTYTDYLRDRDDVLYKTIMNIKALSGDEKSDKIIEIMDGILLSLQEFLDSVDLGFFVTNISTTSGELIKDYLFKLINFFKSHTVQMLSMNVVYSFNSKIDNKLFLFDDMRVSTEYHFNTADRSYILNDSISIGSKELLKKDTATPRDNMFITRTYD